MKISSKILDPDQKRGLIQFEGDLDHPGSSRLLEEIESFLLQGITKWVLDLSKVEFVSSVGIGVIAFSCKEIFQRNGQIRMVCSNAQVLRLLQISKIHEVVPIDATLEQALSQGA